MEAPTVHVGFQGIFVVRHGWYPFDVLVAVAVSDADIASELDRYGVTLSNAEWADLQLRSTSGGRTLLAPRNQTVLRLRGFDWSPGDHAMLAREVFHAVCYLMSCVGIRLTPDSDEAFAYAIAGLTRQILERFAEERI